MTPATVIGLSPIHLVHADVHHCTEPPGGLPPHVFVCKLVPGMRLELTRFWHRPLKTAWLPLHHPGIIWCIVRDSNSRHPTSQIGTLPTELTMQVANYLSYYTPLAKASSWCPRSDSNRHAFRHWLLRPAWLPLHHRGKNKYCMADRDINHGVMALYKHAQTQPYCPTTSWTMSKEFVLADWWQRLDSNQPHTDFQSAALPDELRRQ